MKVIIAGGRDFRDSEVLFERCDYFLSSTDKKSIEIVSGTCKGADRLGEAYGVLRKMKVTQFPADWDQHGKSAGYIRNKEMAEYADALIAFWDGKSKGTKHMITLAKKAKLKVRVVEY